MKNSRITVVIIAKDEEVNIGDSIKSALLITDDIVVVDTGSSDHTFNNAVMAGARVFRISWNGYGHARNAGAKQAKHNWIFSLDADERITASLAEEINAMNMRPSYIYGFRRNNYFINDKIKYGSLSNEKVYRLYHRMDTEWDDAEVHEKLVSQNMTRQLLISRIDHFAISDPIKYVSKRMNYAELCAFKYFRTGSVKAATLLRFISPVYAFVRCFIFQLGVLAGRRGLFISTLNARYTLRKYSILYRLSKSSNAPADLPAALCVNLNSTKVFEAL